MKFYVYMHFGHSHFVPASYTPSLPQFPSSQIVLFPPPYFLLFFFEPMSLIRVVHRFLDILSVSFTEENISPTFSSGPCFSGSA